MQIIHSLILVAILITGCTPGYYPPYSYPQSASINISNAEVQHKFQHKYELSVTDINGYPLSGVKIDYTIKDDHKVAKNGSYSTSFDGVFKESVNITTNQYITTHKSELSYKASKDGYYPKSGTMSSTYGQENASGKSIETEKITLIQPIDYLDNEVTSH